MSIIAAERPFCGRRARARRLEDPNTLFFYRRPTIDGDTELGLLVKNSLDAMDWAHLRGPLEPVIEKLRRLAESHGTRHKPTP